MNRYRPLALVLAATLVLGACQETPAETQEDVTDARVEAAEAVGEARDEARDVAAAATEDTAEARHDVAMARAQGDLEIHKQRCDALMGQEEVACNADATADYEAAKAVAEANLADAQRMADSITR